MTAPVTRGTIRIPCPLCSVAADYTITSVRLIITDDPASRRVEFWCSNCREVTSSHICDRTATRFIGKGGTYKRVRDWGGSSTADLIVTAGERLREAQS